MALGYTCRDCSYEGRNFRQGRCPACGSADIKSLGSAEEDKPRGPLSLIICIGLWLFLGGAILKRFLF